jgi:hypothetical protein
MKRGEKDVLKRAIYETVHSGARFILATVLGLQIGDEVSGGLVFWC